MKNIVQTCLLFLVTAATSCQFYQDKNSDDTALVSIKTVSYRMLMENVLSSRCLRCHTEFNSYETIRSRIAAIEYRALTERDMPPGAPLSRSESQILRFWIDAGMPLNAGETGAPAPPATPLVPTFQSIRDNVFTPRCVTCHGAGGAHDDIDIFDQATLIGPKGWVMSGNPAQSELYQDLLKPDRGRMPPMKSGPALTAEQIDTIRTWILNGAKD